MAVALEELYREVEPMYDMHLVTKSCFHKVIGWTHIVENPEFIELLHGDELIFSAGIQYTSEEWLMDFVQRLIEAGQEDWYCRFMKAAAIRRGLWIIVIGKSFHYFQVDGRHRILM